VVWLANQVHAWVDAHGPDADTATPQLPGTLVLPAGRRLHGRRLTTDQVRDGVAKQLASPAPDPQVLARLVLVDGLLELLQLASLQCGPSARTAMRRKAAHVRRSVTFAALTMLILASSVMATTRATETDRVQMAPVSSQGGTLDIKVDSSTTANQEGTAAMPANWGTFSAALTLMKPGDTRFADITLKNPGTLAARVTVSTTGTDVHADFPAAACFGFYFRERAGAADVQSIGNGTVVGTSEADANVAAFSTSTGPSTLYTNGAVRTATDWASGATRVYRLTVRMRDGCLQGGAGTIGATGTLNFSFNAVQA